MPTLAQIVPIPVEVYLRSTYEPDAEYVDGTIEERAVGEFDHSSWQQAIQRWFMQNEKKWNIRVRPELRIQVAATRFRVPDVTVLDRNAPIEQIVTYPPIAVFEVLSPQDTMRRLKHKLEDYRLMGIPEIWVVDPDDASCSRLHGKQLIQADSFMMSERGISFEMKNIQELLD